MGKPYPLDLRKRVVAAIEGGMSRNQAAKQFGVANSTAIGWMQRTHFAKRDSSFAKSRTAWRRWLLVAWLLKSIGIRFVVFSLGQGACGFFPSHAVAFEGDAVGIVDDTVENGVCHLSRGRWLVMSVEPLT